MATQRLMLRGKGSPGGLSINKSPPMAPTIARHNDPWVGEAQKC
jgi:hypothetical protein